MKPLATIVIATCIGTAICSAQTVDQWISKADAFEKAGKSREALAAFLEADKKRPNKAEILVRIAKQHGDLMTELRDKAAKKQAAESSLAYAKRAVAVNPRSSDAHLAVSLSLGKNTEFMGNRAKIEASREIKASAERALRLNPRSDYAHHMLGRWHQELAQIGGATRALARLVYGGLPAASHDEAIEHFKKARAIRDDRLIHQIEYGRTLAMMGRKTEARESLKNAMAMPSREKDDEDAKRRGREMLTRL